MELPISKPGGARICIDRDPLTQDEFNSTFMVKATPSNALSFIVADKAVHRKLCAPVKLTWICLKRIFPIVVWLQNYQLCDIIYDVAAGLTLSTLNIPQGMAFGELAGLDPIHGLYTSVFPSFIYVFFGTSRYLSVGTFGVISLMISNVRYRFVPVLSNRNDSISSINASFALLEPSLHDRQYSAEEVVSTLCFLVGVLLVICSVCRLGVLSKLMSEQVSGGLLVGVSVVIIGAQLPFCFGLMPRPHQSIGRLFYTVKDLIEDLPATNVYTVLVSIVCASLLLVYKIGLNSCFVRKFKVPFPVDFAVVVLATAVSYFFDFEQLCGTEVIDPLPTGLPKAIMPTFELMPLMLKDALYIAVICFLFAVALCKTLAKNYDEHIEPNQEFFALGVTEIVCSFVGCFPAAAAMGRCEVAAAVGSKSQFANVISSALILIVLLFVAPVFDALPKCVLAVFIIVSLRQILMQFVDLKKLWLTSKVDFFIWLITFLTTASLDVTYGLLTGIFASLVGFAYRCSRSHISQMFSATGTELLVEQDAYAKWESLPCGITAWKFGAPLTYLTADKFKDEFLKSAYLSNKSRLCKPRHEIFAVEDGYSVYSVQTTQTSVCSDSGKSLACVARQISQELQRKQRVLILDCTGMNFVDVNGLEALCHVQKRFTEHGIKLVLACCTASLFATLHVSEKLRTLFGGSHIFPTVLDAVAYHAEPTLNATTSTKPDDLHIQLSSRLPLEIV